MTLFRTVFLLVAFGERFFVSILRTKRQREAHQEDKEKGCTYIKKASN